MTPTFEEIKAARGKCPDCENGEIDAIVIKAPQKPP